MPIRCCSPFLPRQQEARKEKLREKAAALRTKGEGAGTQVFENSRYSMGEDHTPNTKRPRVGRGEGRRAAGEQALPVASRHSPPAPRASTPAAAGP